MATRAAIATLLGCFALLAVLPAPSEARYHRAKWYLHARHRCHEKALEQREEQANVVLTGTVRHLFPDRAHPHMYKGEVEIKRVFKGDNVISAMPAQFIHRHKMVMVDGFGDPHICESKVLMHDTRIFLLSKAANGDLKLNSSVVRVTLNNLNRADAAVADVPFKAKQRPPTDSNRILKAPCERKYCAFGASCIVNAVTKEAECKCKEVCASVFAPVCGSDGTTYSSACHLRAASCTQQRRIKERFQGSCDIPDPCKEKVCQFGAQCVPSLGQNSMAICQCPHRCDTYGDNVGGKPICGDDGVDYPNKCEMRRASCNQMKDIKMKYFGKCDPCHGHRCPVSQVCQLDDNRNPICRCNSLCNLEFSPVCGSDGRTYSNECIMNAEACKNRKEIRRIFAGECTAGKNPCNNLHCGPGQECQVDRQGKAQCRCPPPCEKILRPVCGSDKRTYDNECELRRQACQTKRIVNVSFNGKCGTDGPCTDYKCNYGATCTVENGRPTCKCPSCSGDFQPVCGSDGLSYSNECKLKAENCEQKKNIVVKSRGLCKSDEGEGGCEGMRCDYYSICESDGKAPAKCVCPSRCVEVRSPVCGTDGVTYDNECELQVASCRKQQFIMIASHGTCDLCANIKCNFGARCENGRCVCPVSCPDTNNPVCASNGQTFSNECEMDMFACKQLIELEVRSTGECDEMSGSGTETGSAVVCDETTCRFGGTCELDAEGADGCVCNFNCEAIRSTVCGSDGRTYGNDCEMREASCKMQKEITIQAPDSCEDIYEDLCDGEAPLKNPSTGRDYDCSDVVGDVCPEATYCHKIKNKARCCKKETVVKSCDDTTYGCCPDGITAAPGLHAAGCPSLCQCNVLGSYGATCDPVSKQCSCKPGVGGRQCDRCEPGFWGLPKIKDGNSGCIPCGCNMVGSVRDDCEQMTGRCVCKSGITGNKCNICPNSQFLTQDGCNDESTTSTTTSMPFNSRNTKRHITSKVTRHVMTQTPSTPVFGRIGDVCLSNRDCWVPNSYCRNEFCACREGFTPTTDNTVCAALDQTTPVAEPATTTLVDACASRPCRNGASCMNHPTDGYKCLCPLGKGGDMCDREVTFSVPSFAGHSYMEVRKPHHVNREIAIDMEFRTLNNDGILMYVGHSEDGKGDFLALVIRDGFVEFRFDLGSGMAVIRSNEKVKLNTFHRVSAKRFNQDGMLMLDGRDEAAGRSPGMLQSLNLNDPMYLGYVPNPPQGILNNMAVSMGLVGCIQSFKISSKDHQKTYNLMWPSSRDITAGVDIGECGNNPCSSLPCSNGATCMKIDTDNFKCQCGPGFTGPVCSQEMNPCASNPCQGASTCAALPQGGFMCKCPAGREGVFCQKFVESMQDIFVSEFSGKSYVEHPMTGKYSRTLTLSIWFLATEPNGMLMYAGQLENGKGDFISLNLVEGHLQFRFNLGSGIANVTSPTRIPLNVWNKVDIRRVNRQGSFSINDGPQVEGQSQGILKELNLGQPLYIGGFKQKGSINPESGITQGFHGAIQRIYINGRMISNILMEASDYSGITKWAGPPCNKNPCLNGGQCIPMLNKAHCKCPMSFTGERCELSSDIIDKDRPVSFDGRTYLKYPNKISRREKGQKMNKFRIKFRTTAMSGLMMLQHKTSTVQGDYIALALNGGHLELSFNLGKQNSQNLHIMKSTVPVNDGEWHTVTIDRERRKAKVTVDDNTDTAVTGVATQGATQLDTDGFLWIGGKSNPPEGLPREYYRGFNGCVEEVFVGDKQLHLVDDRITSGSIQFCDDAN